MSLPIALGSDPRKSIIGQMVPSRVFELLKQRCPQDVMIISRISTSQLDQRKPTIQRSVTDLGVPALGGLVGHFPVVMLLEAYLPFLPSWVAAPIELLVLSLVVIFALSKALAKHVPALELRASSHVIITGGSSGNSPSLPADLCLLFIIDILYNLCFTFDNDVVSWMGWFQGRTRRVLRSLRRPAPLRRSLCDSWPIPIFV